MTLFQLYVLVGMAYSLTHIWETLDKLGPIPHEDAFAAMIAFAIWHTALTMFWPAAIVVDLIGVIRRRKF